jgi:predicted Rossmann fold nucleotide-binding protein DprA/Smf involved in DNA uptake
MIVAIVGSRNFADYLLFQRVVDEFCLNNQVTGLVSGGARGADKLAERYAAERKLEIEVLKPDWSKGRGAGIARNADIVAKADAVITFWDGRSPGTRNTIQRAVKAGKPVVAGLK